MLLLPLCLIENCQKGPLNADIFCCCVFMSCRSSSWKHPVMLCGGGNQRACRLLMV